MEFGFGIDVGSTMGFEPGIDGVFEFSAMITVTVAAAVPEAVAVVRLLILGQGRGDFEVELKDKGTERDYPIREAHVRL